MGICAVPPPQVQPQRGVVEWLEELMVWGHLLGTVPARGGTCRLRLLCAVQEVILGMKLQSSDLGESAVGLED